MPKFVLELKDKGYQIKSNSVHKLALFVVLIVCTEMNNIKPQRTLCWNRLYDKVCR
jgi:hypothetical protein